MKLVKIREDLYLNIEGLREIFVGTSNDERRFEVNAVFDGVNGQLCILEFEKQEEALTFVKTLAERLND